MPISTTYLKIIEIDERIVNVQVQHEQMSIHEYISSSMSTW